MTATDTRLAAQQALDEQRWRDAVALCTTGLPGTADPAARAEMLLVWARACWHLADLAECHRLARLANEQAFTAGDEATQIRAGTLAAFALAELHFEEQALSLAAGALALAERPAHYALLPLALSSLGHVHARLGRLEEAELLHLRALSHARETGDTASLQLVHDNLLLSLVAVLRRAELQGDSPALVSAQQRSRQHIAAARRLLGAELPPWRDLSLRSRLAMLEMLCGRFGSAEALVAEVLPRAQQSQSHDIARSATVTAAEIQHRQGRHADALARLSAQLDDDDPMARPELTWRRLRIQRDCHAALGDPVAAEQADQRLQASQALFEALRGAVRQSLDMVN